MCGFTDLYQVVGGYCGAHTTCCVDCVADEGELGLVEADYPCGDYAGVDADFDAERLAVLGSNLL